MQSCGWLFDVYPTRTTMVVWLYQDDGTLLRLEDPWRPRLYAQGAPADLRALTRRLEGTRAVVRWYQTTRQEFWRGTSVPVLALEMMD